MKITVTENMFIDSFVGGYANNFTYEARQALFEYLDECMGDDWELDPVAICCDFTEFDDLGEFNREHGETCDSIDDVSDLTLVIPIDDDSFIIQNY